MPIPTRTGHVNANGINYYFAIYGKGEPLLLLHGGLGQIEMFGPNLAALAAEHQVIGVDLQGHGRTPWATGRSTWLISVTTTRSSSIPSATSRWTSWATPSVAA
jgi:pimeloyl-ACP methyl ester carboxylesterase